MTPNLVEGVALYCFPIVPNGSLIYVLKAPLFA